MYSIEDALFLVQLNKEEEITGFTMGYYKQFDDLKAYYLEEIVIFDGFQNLGYGSELMKEIEDKTKKNGCELIELIAVNDEMHNHFYNKLGFYASKNLNMMGKHF